MSTKHKLNIEVIQLSRIDTFEQLNNIGKYVIGLATHELEWYRRSIRPKRLISTTIRFLSLFSLGIAAVIPLLGAIISSLKVDAIWISVAITFAGGLIALDKYLGFSSGWIRYIKTFMLIEMKTRVFSLEWDKQISLFENENPTKEVITSLLDMAIKYLEEIQLFIREETNAWIQEFSNTMKEVEELVKQKKQEMKNGDI